MSVGARCSYSAYINGFGRDKAEVSAMSVHVTPLILRPPQYYSETLSNTTHCTTLYTILSTTHYVTSIVFNCTSNKYYYRTLPVASSLAYPRCRMLAFASLVIRILRRVPGKVPWRVPQRVPQKVPRRVP